MSQDAELAANIREFGSPSENRCAPLFYRTALNASTVNFDIDIDEESNPCPESDSSEAEVEADQPRPPCRPQPSM